VILSLDENQVIDEIEAAKILGRAVQTLRNDRHLRQGPAYIKLGRSVRYQVKDLIDYLQRNKIDPEKVS
jgi:hypothetical protein